MSNQSTKEKLLTSESHDWIEWHGGECPVGREFIVEVEMRDGIRYTDRAPLFSWRHATPFSPTADIVRYRVVRSVFSPEQAGKAIGAHYDYTYKGVKLDPYRIFLVYGIGDPAIQHAVKKLLRAGRSIKPLRRDLEEVIVTLQRRIEMLDEDWGTEE